MSTDWGINFNHMEGLTDRCYRVTLSYESQSGDSLGEIGFSERKQNKKVQCNAEPTRFKVLFPQGFLIPQMLGVFFSAYSF